MVHQGKLLPTYCIDSSALIDINRGYPERNAFFTDIWKKMDELFKDDRLIAPIEVYKEIDDHEDEVFFWCRDRKSMFIDVDIEQREWYWRIQKGVRSTRAQYQS